MTLYRVWAPDRTSVEVERDGRRTPMIQAGGGWWQVEAEDASPEAGYAFVLDGERPLPDPRSPWQPAGVHGPSRTVDHSRFVWTDQRWQAGPLASAVIYELHTGTFTTEGTFEAAIDRLDHLTGLGITHVELMPVNEFAGSRGWGYDGVDVFAPNHGYGGPESLKRLVNACHERGLAVILDVVYNHLGPEGNYLAQFGPYFTDRYNTPWGSAINLDGPGSDEVRRFLCDNALMWLRDYHFDGLRLDAVHALLDTSAVHILEQLAGEVETIGRTLNRNLLLIAESDLNDARLLWSRERGGYGLNAQWNEDFHHALHAMLSGERAGYYADFGRIADFAATLERGFAYDGRYSAFHGRRHGRSAADLSGDRLVGCLQNHDQIGNRAGGDRSASLLTADRLKIGAALVLASPFIPMLFQGEEWGASTPFQYFTGFEDTDLGRAVREGRQREFAAFGWKPEDIPDPQDPATFTRSKLDWSEPAREPHASLLEWHRRLITLRRDLPSLRDGRMEEVRTRFSEEDRWLVVERGAVTIVCNLSDRAQSVPAHPGRPGGVLLCSGDAPNVTESAIDLLPDTVAILGPQPGR